MENGVWGNGFGVFTENIKITNATVSDLKIEFWNLFEDWDLYFEVYHPTIHLSILMRSSGPGYCDGPKKAARMC